MLDVHFPESINITEGYTEEEHSNSQTIYL